MFGVWLCLAAASADVGRKSSSLCEHDVVGRHSLGHRNFGDIASMINDDVVKKYEFRVRQRLQTSCHLIKKTEDEDGEDEDEDEE